jgi:hypothetical protein
VIRVFPRVRIGLVAIVLIAAFVVPPGSQPSVKAGQDAVSVEEESLESAGIALQELADTSGALGSYWDQKTQAFVYVVSSSDASVPPLGLAANGFATRVETRDISRADIGSISDALLGLRAKLSKYAYGFGFDIRSGQIFVQSEAPKGEFSSLIDSYPGMISFRSGEWSLASWSNDSAPFKGGAWENGSHSCTAGFTVTQSSVRKMAIAGHCILANESTNMGTGQTGAWYPDYDIALIRGSTYATGIWDSASTTRVVHDATNTTIGSKYCTTGRTSGFRCSWEVISRGVTICYTQGYPSGACAHGLVGFVRDDRQPIEPGDSGGPLWKKYADGTAGVRGVISGYFFDYFYGFVSYATEYLVIHNQVGVTAATCPTCVP